MTTDEYIAQHIDAEPPRLTKLYRDTHLNHLYPRMCSGHVQGRLLKMLTMMINPRRVLEIGTYTGYATLCIAEGLMPGSTIDTIEIDDEMEDELRQTFASVRGHVDIALHIGDALEVIPSIDHDWDMVLIDANKRHYTRYLDAVIDRVPVGGYILADNTLWDSKVLDGDEIHDAQTRAIADFNDYVAGCPRLSKVIIPVRDGLTIMRRLS